MRVTQRLPVRRVVGCLRDCAREQRDDDIGRIEIDGAGRYIQPVYSALLIPKTGKHYGYFGPEPARGIRKVNRVSISEESTVRVPPCAFAISEAM